MLFFLVLFHYIYGVQVRLHVLVAEDNLVNQQVITRLLKRLNHTVTVVDNGKRAVEEFEKRGNEYDLILMDVQMPVMDGVEATRQVYLFSISFLLLSLFPFLCGG